MADTQTHKRSTVTLVHMHRALISVLNNAWTATVYIKVRQAIWKTWRRNQDHYNNVSLWAVTHLK